MSLVILKRPWFAPGDVRYRPTGSQPMEIPDHLIDFLPRDAEVVEGRQPNREAVKTDGREETVAYKAKAREESDAFNAKVAEVEAEQIISKAEDDALIMFDEAKTECDALIDEARTRAAQIIADAEAVVAEPDPKSKAKK